MSKLPTDYPTVQVAGGYKDKCVKLETKDTGSFGAMVKMYIAAGNLFIGAFDLANALKDAPKATTFGFQFYKRPKTLKGYYKFKQDRFILRTGSLKLERKIDLISMLSCMRPKITHLCWMEPILLLRIK